MRLFFAIEVAGGAESALDRALVALRAEGADVAWVWPPWHLTLVFLGETPESRLDAALAAARRAATAPAFEAALARLGAFPSWSRARVVWAGPGSGKEALTALGSGLQAELQREGFGLEERTFVPHATLGRVRSSQGREVLARAASRWDEEPASWAGAGFPVEGFTLFKSELRPEGALHAELARFPLRAAPSSQRTCLGAEGRSPSGPAAVGG